MITSAVDCGEQPLVHLSVAGTTATVVLDSPGNRNALSARLLEELAAAIDEALGDERVRVIVLTHAGPVFCSGADLKESAPGPARVPATRLFEMLWTAPKPVVARLAGPARAGGVGLVAACDLAIAADHVRFAFTEVRIGVVPAVISVLLRERVTSAALHELFLTGRSFDAERAVAAGLLTAAVPIDQLDAEVDRLARDLTLGAPGALATTKRLMRDPAVLRAGLAAMQAVSERAFASAEGQEGLRAFAENRPPAWARDAAAGGGNDI